LHLLRDVFTLVGRYHVGMREIISIELQLKRWTIESMEKKRRILVADDSEAVINLLETMLHSWGYTPVTCSCGKEAFEALRQEDAPKLVLLDWLMNDMDGIEVCRRLRNLYPHERFYIIMLTGKTEPHEVADGLNAGADDYIEKPVSMVELRARIHAGMRIVELQEKLEAKIRELESAHVA
jgi:DNA-binding response OmpR family regulator